LSRRIDVFDGRLNWLLGIGHWAKRSGGIGHGALQQLTVNS
jgi:hypothetical protein